MVSKITSISSDIPIYLQAFFGVEKNFFQENNKKSLSISQTLPFVFEKVFFGPLHFLIQWRFGNQATHPSNVLLAEKKIIVLSGFMKIQEIKISRKLEIVWRIMCIFFIIIGFLYKICFLIASSLYREHEKAIIQKLKHDKKIKVLSEANIETEMLGDFKVFPSHVIIERIAGPYLTIQDLGRVSKVSKESYKLVCRIWNEKRKKIYEKHCSSLSMDMESIPNSYEFTKCMTFILQSRIPTIMIKHFGGIGQILQIPSLPARNLDEESNYQLNPKIPHDELNAEMPIKRSANFLKFHFRCRSVKTKELGVLSLNTEDAVNLFHPVESIRISWKSSTSELLEYHIKSEKLLDLLKGSIFTLLSAENGNRIKPTEDLDIQLDLTDETNVPIPKHGIRFII